MKSHPLFKDIEYKKTDGGAEHFPKLSIKVKKELVTLSPEKEFDVFNSSKGLTPKQWHKYLTDNPNVILLDARNDYESEIGVFKGENLIAPKIKTFRDIKDHLKNLPKNETILTYYTNNVRCEYLSAYMQSEGFKDVHHLKGGIVKYGQEFGDDGLWQGKCYTFDDRMKLGFSDKSEDIGVCRSCGKNTSEQINCSNLKCNELQVMCLACQDANAPCYKCGSKTRGRESTKQDLINNKPNNKKDDKRSKTDQTI
jgi:UPF0176 protein